MIPGLPAPGDGLELAPESVAGLAPEIAGGRCRLIDCREPDEWAINRLPGARLIPLSGFAEGAAPLVADAIPVIVYCHHGMRSQRAASWLRARGLERAWSLAGGIDRWSAEIDPTVPRY